jgi:rhamnosyltransferase
VQYAGGPHEYRKMLPARRRRLAAFDNVSSCLRRSVWEEMPFDRTNFGEDIRWGKRVVEAGYKTIYEPRSAVIHSHERGAIYDLRRYYVNQRILLELFGFRIVSNLRHLLLAIPRTSLYLYRLLRQDQEMSKRRLRPLMLATKYALVTQIGTYLGARSDLLARLSPRAFGKLHRFLSKGI